MPGFIIIVCMKTIFITSFFGLSARNILSTGILGVLANDSETRVVILGPEKKKEDYQGNFSQGRKNIIVEGLNFKDAVVKGIKLETASNSWLERLFFSLALNSLDTNSRKVIRIEERHNKNRYIQTFFHWILAKLSNLKLFRKFIRHLDQKLLSKNRFSEYFEKYQPALVFATDIYNEHDVQLMREARSRKIPIVGMVRSWDNITSHGLNRIVPDKLITNTPKIKEEAIRYCDIKEEDIFVGGIPHYDRYVSQKRISKEDLFKSLNLDPNKKTVFFAPPANIYTKNNPISNRIIKEIGKLEDVQLIIRLYVVGEVDLGGIKPIPNKIAIDAPPQHLNFVDADLAPKQDEHLADLLQHSDVVAAFASTLAIDAAVFGKPIVFVGFDASERPYWKSLRQYYDFDHQQYILKTGGVKLAENMTEFVKYVKDYLDNPNLDLENRKKISELFCWKLDGKSSERVGNFLLNQLHGKQ